MKRQDPDLVQKSIGELRREVMRLRTMIRMHRDAEGNARCHHNDEKLYERALPEAKSAGRMDQPLKILLPKCRQYIRRQQCTGKTCPWEK